MDAKQLLDKMAVVVAAAKADSIQSLRTTSDIETIKYIQGYLDSMEDMYERLRTVYKNLMKETLLDDED